MKLLLALVVAMAWAMPTYACDVEFTKAKLCGTVEFSSSPVVNKDSPFLVSLSDMSGVRTELPAVVEAVLWMQMGSHGHGSKPTTVTRFQKSGSALVSNAYFVMGGTWLVKLKLYDLDSQGQKVLLDEAEYSVDL